MLCIIKAVKINMNSGNKDNVHRLIQGNAFFTGSPDPLVYQGLDSGFKLVCIWMGLVSSLCTGHFWAISSIRALSWAVILPVMSMMLSI